MKERKICGRLWLAADMKKMEKGVCRYGGSYQPEISVAYVSNNGDKDRRD